MPREKRTDQDLQEVSDHLYYEIWMLTSLAHGIKSGIAGEGPIANALLEAFVTHVRVLIDFLYNESPQPDDVIAEDYFSSSEEWRKIRTGFSKLLKQTKHRAGKEVAHLTYARLDVTPETKPWRFVEIANEISAVINLFIEHVPKSKLGQRWKTINKA